MNSFEAKRPEGEALASDRGALGSLMQIKKMPNASARSCET